MTTNNINSSRSVPSSLAGTRPGRQRRRRWGLGVYFVILVSFGFLNVLRGTLHANKLANVSVIKGSGLTETITNSGGGTLPEDASFWLSNRTTIAGTTSSVQSIGRHHSRAQLNQLQMGPIFYNLFFPSYRENYDLNTTDSANLRVLNIMKEQIEQLKTTVPNSTILITLIGRNENIKDPATFLLHEQIQSICGSNNNNHCQIRESLVEGTEAHTLHAMWKYCQTAMATTIRKINNNGGQKDDVLVTYIHDKGSFHPTESNEHARWHGTKGALECRSLMQADPSRCTACTSKFNVIPQYHGNANMWTAKCSYLRKLYPPHNYSAAMKSMYDNTLFHPKLRETPKYACLQPNHTANNHLGLGRYSLERWLWSHPDLQPCSVLPRQAQEMLSSPGGGSFPRMWTPKLRRAPLSPPKGVGMQFGPYKFSYARLDGRLFEWQYIYGTIPKNNSWVWKWYKGFEHGTDKWMKQCNGIKRKKLRKLVGTLG